TTAVAKISDQSLLPVLVRQDQLMDGNSKLGISEAVSEVGGASLAGVLITIITAPFALIADALSYLVSAGLLSKIERDEVSKSEEKPVSGFW
ncbi:MAG: MFS transporter, partial [Proteobacteria bacterium]|nr:MFS transporter [Pseudomonadota bacterium]